MCVCVGVCVESGGLNLTLIFSWKTWLKFKVALPITESPKALFIMWKHLVFGFSQINVSCSNINYDKLFYTTNELLLT